VDAPSNLWVVVTGYATAMVSALLPWINGELLMLAAAPMASKRGVLLPLVVAFTLGQMTGKCAMYWLTRTATTRRSPGVDAAIQRWRGPFARHPRRALALVFVSAVIGLPPFYAVSIAAGGLRMPFGSFALVGTVGRFFHFGLLATVPRTFGWM
jgi:membrane protein YqaA with SNARE-associated domain